MILPTPEYYENPIMTESDEERLVSWHTVGTKHV